MVEFCNVWLALAIPPPCTFPICVGACNLVAGNLMYLVFLHCHIPSTFMAMRLFSLFKICLSDAIKNLVYYKMCNHDKRFLVTLWGINEILVLICQTSFTRYLFYIYNQDTKCLSFQGIVLSNKSESFCLHGKCIVIFYLLFKVGTSICFREPFTG